MHQGLPSSGLSSSKLMACGPPLSYSTFSSFGTSSPTMGPKCDNDACVLFKYLKTRIE
jgi:hypothetical protein